MSAYRASVAGPKPRLTAIGALKGLDAPEISEEQLLNAAGSQILQNCLHANRAMGWFFTDMIPELRVASSLSFLKYAFRRP